MKAAVLSIVPQVDPLELPEGLGLLDQPLVHHQLSQFGPQADLALRPLRSANAANAQSMSIRIYI